MAVNSLPAPAWIVLGTGGLLLWLAGRNLNQTAVTVQEQGAPGYVWNPFMFRFGRPFRHPMDVRHGEPGGPQSPEPQTAPGTLPEIPLPGSLPQTDSAAPPYNTGTVVSQLTQQPRPGITYIEAGDSDNLYTVSVRNYNTPLRAVDIFNANRQGVIRADGTPGIMASPDFIQPGTRLIIP